MLEVVFETQRGSNLGARPGLQQLPRTDFMAMSFMRPRIGLSGFPSLSHSLFLTVSIGMALTLFDNHLFPTPSL